MAKAKEKYNKDSDEITISSTSSSSGGSVTGSSSSEATASESGDDDSYSAVSQTRPDTPDVTPIDLSAVPDSPNEEEKLSDYLNRKKRSFLNKKSESPLLKTSSLRKVLTFDLCSSDKEDEVVHVEVVDVDQVDKEDPSIGNEESKTVAKEVNELGDTPLEEGNEEDSMYVPSDNSASPSSPASSSSNTSSKDMNYTNPVSSFHNAWKLRFITFNELDEYVKKEAYPFRIGRNSKECFQEKYYKERFPERIGDPMRGWFYCIDRKDVS